MGKAVLCSGATVLSSHKNSSNSNGVSSTIIIEESNFSIQTWPDFGYAAVDCLISNDIINPWKAFEYLKKELKAKKINTSEI